jgi:predicted amidohydrolase
MRHIRSEVHIGLVQMRCEKGAVDANLAATREYLRDALAQGVDTLCFPEASITGHIEPARYPEAVLPLDHRAVARFVGLTAEGPVTALAGLVELNPAGRPYVTQVVARAGQLLGVYRKRTIPADGAELYAAATTPDVFADPRMPFGVAICADIDNGALFAEHARAGARVIFEAAAPGLYGPQETRDWQAGFDWWRGECCEKLGGYARSYGVYIAVASQAGRTRDEDFPGGGYVFGRDGRCLAATTDWREGVLYVTLDLTDAENR